MHSRSAPAWLQRSRPTGRWSLFLTLLFSPGFGKGVNVVNFEGSSWHEYCFNCKRCSLNLSDKRFVAKGRDILCSDCGNKEWLDTTLDKTQLSNLWVVFTMTAPTFQYPPHFLRGIYWRGNSDTWSLLMCNVLKQLCPWCSDRLL